LQRQTKIASGLVKITEIAKELSGLGVGKAPCRRAMTVMRLTMSCVRFAAFSWFSGSSSCEATSVGWVFRRRRLWPASLLLQLLLPSSNSESGWNLDDQAEEAAFRPRSISPDEYTRHSTTYIWGWKRSKES
jgi:hypothetical protein